jgi:predicted secreted protein with PEFG-CTERM motif
MKSKLIGSLFVVLALVVGIMTFAPSAFADTSVSMTKGAAGGQACVTAGNCFDPADAKVAAGDTVTWTNDDTASHTVTSGNPNDNTTGTVFDSSLVKAGGTFSFKFTDAGTYNYFCQVHPWMTGMVTVGAAGSEEPSTPPPTDTTKVPEFGSIASLILVIAIVSVVAVTAKIRLR